MKGKSFYEGTISLALQARVITPDRDAARERLKEIGGQVGEIIQVETKGEVKAIGDPIVTLVKKGHP